MGQRSRAQDKTIKPGTRSNANRVKQTRMEKQMKPDPKQVRKNDSRMSPVSQPQTGPKAVSKSTDAITTYDAPDLSGRPEPKLRKLKCRSLKFDSNAHRIANIRAFAESVGQTVTEFLHCAVWIRQFALAEELGINYWEAHKLSRDERARFARKYKLVSRIISGPHRRN